MKIEKNKIQKIDGQSGVETLDELILEQVKKFCITQPTFLPEFNFDGIPILGYPNRTEEKETYEVMIV